MGRGSGGDRRADRPRADSRRPATHGRQESKSWQPPQQPSGSGPSRVQRGRDPPVHDRHHVLGPGRRSRRAPSSPSSSPIPALNLGLEWTTFGRLRPLHTSAVIFAFGGNALLGTSLYVVQRTCRAPLFGGPLVANFLFWGYQLFIVWPRWATCSASPRAANTPSPNGTSTCG